MKIWEVQKGKKGNFEARSNDLKHKIGVMSDPHPSTAYAERNVKFFKIVWSVRFLAIEMF